MIHLIEQSRATDDSTNGHSGEGVRVRMEEDVDAMEALLAGICKGSDTYSTLARQLFPTIITEKMADSTVRAVVTLLAKKHLTQTERAAHKTRSQRILSSEDARAAALENEKTNGFFEFTHAHQLKSIEARGDKRWHDQEEFVLIALARKFKKKEPKRLWQNVADDMNFVFQTDQFERLQCRAHGLAIFQRHKNGKYSRVMPETNVDAFNYAIDVLLPPQNGVDAVTARTIGRIQMLLMQESNPDSASLALLIEEVHLFLRTTDLLCINEREKQKAKEYRTKLVQHDLVVEAFGEEELYRKLTTIIDWEKGKITPIINP